MQEKTESSLKSQAAKLLKKMELQAFLSMNISDMHEKDLLHLLKKGHLGVISHKNSLKSMESEWR